MKETRKLNTILFADIAGYTSIMHSNEARAMEYLKIFKRLLEHTVTKFEGQIVQYFGDACLISFDSATLGVKCAISLQQEFQENSLPIRIGMHLGEVIFTENNVFGDGVNIASRIESMGIPGSVLLSSAIRNQIMNKNEFSLISLGSFEFKNVEEPIEVFAINNVGISVPVKSEIQGKFNEPSRKPNKLIWYSGILAVAIALFFTINYFRGTETINGKSIPTGILPNSIAVLPLINLSNNENLEYFSDGVTQEIIDELAKISSIEVRAFSTTLQYKNQEKSQLEIAKELGVKYLISGSSRLLENDKRVRLTIELINPHTNKRIWNTTFDEALKDAVSIQLAVAKKVADYLDIKLTTSEQKNLEKPNTLSGEAFRLFLHAKAEINKLSPEGFANGTRYLKKALELDPNYSQALTLLAWRYTVGASADFSPGTISTSESVSLAQPIIDKALALDPESSDIYLVRANLKLYSQNKIKDATEDVNRAFALNSWPQIPTNYCICTAVSAFIASDDLVKAKEVAELAKKIDPGHVLYDWDLGNIAMKQGNYVQALDHYKTSAKKADIPFFNTFVGWSYYYNGQFKEALEILHKAYKYSPLPARLNVSALSNTYYKMGDQNKSNRYLQELLDREATGEHHLNLYIADIYLERNEISKSLDFLEKGLNDSDFGFAVFLSLIPKFKALENEPRFQKILVRIQSPGI